MADQAFFAWGIKNPARLALVYQRDSLPEEDRFVPREQFELEGKNKMDTLVTGLVEWGRRAINVFDADYGRLYLKEFQKRLQTVQPVFIWSQIMRLGIAHQTVSQALYGFGMVFLGAVPAYAFPWTIAMIGGQYPEKKQAENKKYLDAKGRIGQGLRLIESGNVEAGRAQVTTGYDMLTKIYVQHRGVDLPKELRAVLAEAEAKLGIEKGSGLSQLKEIRDFYGQAARLAESLAAGDETKIRETYNSVLEQYDSSVSEELRDLNARALLAWVLKNPAFNNKENSKVTFIANWGTGITTTYFAITLFVASYGGANIQGMMGMAKLAAVFYGSLALAQFGAVDFLKKRLDRIKEHAVKVEEQRRFKNGTLEEVIVPENFSAFREMYIKERVASFRTTREVVEQEMSREGVVERLKSMHQRSLVEQSKKADARKCAAALTPMSFGRKAKIFLFGGA